MIYIDGTPTSDDTLPMVLWDNQMSQGTLTASSSAADGPYTNAVTETTYDYWKPTSLPANLTVIQTSSITTSMVAIVGHNLGSTNSYIKVQYSSSDVTNLLLRSEEFENAVWVKQGSPTIIANNTLAPDGTMLADRIINVNGSTSVGVYQAVFLPSGQITFSIFLKAYTTTSAVLGAYATSFLTGSATILSGPGSISGTNLFTVTGLSTTEWTRISYTVTSPSATASLYVYPETTGAGSGRSIFAWGAQVETGSVANSYIKTTTSSTTSGWRDASDWVAPTDDTTLLIKHRISTASAGWRIVVSGVTIPYIGICILGTPLVLPGGVRPGYTPIWQAQKVELLQSKSLGGQFLGNRILRQGAETSIGLVSFSRSFAEADLQPFKAWYNGGHAFIWASGPSIFTKDVGYCWRKPNAEMRPTFTETGNWVDVTMEVEAYVQ